MSADDSMWAPPGEGDDTPPPGPLDSGPSLPDAPSQWAPPAVEPQVLTPPPAAPPVPDEPAGTDAPESVSVGPIAASTVSGASHVGRVVAAILALAMVGGGAFLAFGAGTADGGAESPEAALERAIDAVQSGDLLALAEVMEPGERATLFDAGFAFLDDMVRLEVLAEDFDAASVGGVTIEYSDTEMRVEQPRDDLARIYIESGQVVGEVDVAVLPIGRRVLDRLSPEQQSFTNRQVDVLAAQETPYVAVRRDGRWYLSVWYTVAESVRLTSGAALPDPLDRPAPIGASSPEAAAVRFLEEAARFDLARMIGMLDPEEAAALYEYSPLFLDESTAAANGLLERANARGWSWGFDELEFRAETEGDLANVFLERLTFTATGDDGSASVTIADGELSAEVTMIDDFWGETTSWSVVTSDGCLRVVVRQGTEEERVDSCDESSAVVGSSALRLHDIGLVARRVDDRWYLSPVRTTLDAMIAAVEQLDGAGLDEALGQTMLVPGMVLGASGSGFDIPAPDAPLATFETDLENADLLAAELDVKFSYDLDPEQAIRELDLFAPGLDQIDLVRGAYATVAGGVGEVAVIVVEVADPGQAFPIFVDHFERTNDIFIDPSSDGATRVALFDDFGDPVFAELDGSILTVVGVYGTDSETAFAVLEAQTAR